MKAGCNAQLEATDKDDGGGGGGGYLTANLVFVIETD